MRQRDVGRDGPKDERDPGKAGANSYVEKPVGLGKFLEALERLKDYWLEISILRRT